MNKDSAPLLFDNTEYNKIIPTAWLTAYPKTLTDLPYAQDFFTQLENERQKAGQKVALELINPKLAPEIEARSKLITKIILDLQAKQVLELAAGLSTRGLILSAQKQILYREVDLPDLVTIKSKIIDSLVEKKILPPPDKRYSLLSGNVLNKGELQKISQDFDFQSPLIIANEGLLRYLSFDEKRIVALNILSLLAHFSNGYWVTSDITLKKFIREQNTNEVGNNQQIEKLTQKNFSQNGFENLQAAETFFNQLGFEVVEKHSFLEVLPDLVSPTKLGLSLAETTNLIKTPQVFVMKPQKF